MGIGVSNWTLARAVSQTGQLGVVSGTALATLLVRRLQTGDPGGAIREALDAFPGSEWPSRILKQYFVPGGKADDTGFRNNPMTQLSRPLAKGLTMVANFVEIHLAKRGHTGVVGTNLLEKNQTTTLASLYGAMLAGVDYVLMGAGIPRSIPRVLDQFANSETVELKIDVQGALRDERFLDRLDPAEYGLAGVRLKRPAFIGIVSSTALAKTLATRAEGSVEGLVVEGPPAGGHNAPPRGTAQFTESGETKFGERDLPDIAQIRALGLPFWLAGAYGRPSRLAKALASGATGIQVGTAFAFCEESGLRADLKAEALRKSRTGENRVFTDPHASPTGFPFKVLEAEGTLSEEAVYQNRKRICDLGYLRTPYRRDDGSVGYRCPGEPVEDYQRKGGSLEATRGRKCLCNGLFAAVGLGQIQKHGVEPAILTAGDDINQIAEFLPEYGDTYSAADVVGILLKGSLAISQS